MPQANQPKRKKRSSNPGRSAVDTAIVTQLAPEVAIALLGKTEQAAGAPEPALECIAAGVSESEDADKVRVQLMFENGMTLPVEMPVEAGTALARGLGGHGPAEGSN